MNTHAFYRIFLCNTTSTKNSSVSIVETLIKMFAGAFHYRLYIKTQQPVITKCFKHIEKIKSFLTNFDDLTEHSFFSVFLFFNSIGLLQDHLLILIIFLRWNATLNNHKNLSIWNRLRQDWIL